MLTSHWRRTIIFATASFFVVAMIFATGSSAGDTRADGRYYAQASDEKDIRKGKKSIKDYVNEQKMKNQRNLQDQKDQLDRVRKLIKDKNLHFIAELNEQMKYKIAEITGAQVPKNIKKDAKVKSDMGDQMWDEFMKKYEEYLKQKYKKKWEEKYGKRDRDRRRRDDNYDNNRGDDYSYNDDRKKDNRRKDDYQDKKDDYKDRKNDNRDEKKDEQNTDIDNAPNPSARAFNWRDARKVTTIKNQMSCGSCWAFTSCAALEANLMIRQNAQVDLSEQYILDCAEAQNQDAGSCAGGWYGTVYEFLKTNGAKLENQYPYQNKDVSCPRSLAATSYKVVAWGYVKPDAGIPSQDEMKKALCKYGPLAACVKVTEAFQAYKSGIFDEFCSTSGERDINHAIVIVGWDDNKQAYLVKNSWSERWGDKGYVWVKYGSNNIGYGAAWLVVDHK